MKLWRICRKRYVDSAFSGIGAERDGGRWNLPGHAMVYTSTSLSLATLELFVNLKPQLAPPDLYWVSAELPDDACCETIAATDLPFDWQAYPAPKELRELGSRWLNEQRSLALIVPSAVNPLENNVLLNPRHAEIHTLDKIESEPFQFDPRMWN